MASLIISDLDDDIVARLKARASENGCSVEAVHRAILGQALAPEVPKVAWGALHGKMPKVA